MTAAETKRQIGPHHAYTEGPVLFVSFDGDFSYQEATELLAFVEQQYGTRPYYALCDITKQGHTSPAARRLLTEWTENKQLRAAAMIGGSIVARTVARLVANAIRIFGKKSIPMAFVQTLAEGKAWLDQERQRSPD